jgi:hypothetical protein
MNWMSRRAERSLRRADNKLERINRAHIAKGVRTETPRWLRANRRVDRALRHPHLPAHLRED